MEHLLSLCSFCPNYRAIEELKAAPDGYVHFVTFSLEFERHQLDKKNNQIIKKNKIDNAGYACTKVPTSLFGII